MRRPNVLWGFFAAGLTVALWSPGASAADGSITMESQ